MTDDRAVLIARIIHGATSQIDRPDGSTPAVWDELSPECKENAVMAVAVILGNPPMTAKQAHKLWARLKMESGWAHGLDYCDVNKTHPCLVKFKDLPASEKLKDELWVAITNLFRENQ